MMRRLIRAFYRVRYFPRLLIELLNRISGDIAQLRVAHQADYRRGSATLRDIHAEIGSFCDDVTRVLLEHKRQSSGTTHQVAEIQQNIARLAAAITEVRPLLLGELAILRQDAAAARADGDRRVLDAVSDNGRAVAETGRTIAAHAQEVALLRDQIREQARTVERLDRAVAQQTQLFPSWIWTPESADRVRSLLALLAPAAIPGTAKLRIGRDLDGGYVMLDDFAGIAAALSLGISDDVSWDLDIARRGIRVLQFDPTVPASPEQHELFEFEPLRVVPRDQPGGISLEAIVRNRVANAGAPLLLKIDIEGAEWDVLLATSDDTLRRFKQIVCEFHDLDRLGEQDFGSRAHELFTKLARTHIVTHVHGNNCGNFANVGNIVVPQSLEVLFVLRSAYRASDSHDVFPTPLDRPNQPGRADLFLGQFRFDGQPADISASAARTPAAGTSIDGSGRTLN